MSKVTVLDTSCLIYLIHNSIDSLEDTPINPIIDRTVKLLINNYFTLDNHFIAVLDTKVDGKYWRDDLVKKDSGNKYKTGRKKKSLNWYSILERVLTIFKSLNIPMVGLPTYEADDVAALIVKCAKDRGVAVDLFTVDSDWMGLIDEPNNILWLNMANYPPKVRFYLKDINEWSNRRLKETLEKPSDIWTVKAAQGDASDNLPSGTNIGLIDLLNPVEGYDLYKTCPHVGYRALEQALKLDFPSTDNEDENLDLMGEILSVTSLPLTGLDNSLRKMYVNQ